MTSGFDENATGPLCEEDDEHLDTATVFAKNIVPEERKMQIVWRNVVLFVLLHAGAAYGAFLFFTSAKLVTLFFWYTCIVLSTWGVAAGAHRLWTHRCFKAKRSLRVFLMLCNSLAFENSILEWSRDHRVHHKFTETDADPHNAKRGFFFAHMGWLMVRKHPDVKLKGKGVDMSDLLADPVVRFQHRYYLWLVLLMCFVVPTVVPWFFWDETVNNAFFVCVMMRYCLSLHGIWLINSASHMWGQRPYDKYIQPVDNKAMAFLTMGEGRHNYHHTFPWDYKGEELAQFATNYTTIFLNVCAYLGLVYDLKSVSADVVRRRVQRTGDGSHPVWGWGDRDLTQRERDDAVITMKKNK